MIYILILASWIPHRVGSFASETGVQVSTWTELPREVIETVMKNISLTTYGLVERLAVPGPPLPRRLVSSNL